MSCRQTGRRHRAAACASAALLSLAWLAARPTAAQTIYGDGFEDGTGCGWSAFVISTEPFAGADGAPWPSPWSVAGSVDVGDLSVGRGRLRPTPSTYSLARMTAPTPTRDVEVAFALSFEQQSTQGVGFYVRQNGGYLQQTNPEGQGYAIFVEGFRGFPRLGLWKEQGGVETELAFLNLATPFVDGLVYRARFRTIQAGRGHDAPLRQGLARLGPRAGGLAGRRRRLQRRPAARRDRRHRRRLLERAAEPADHRPHLRRRDRHRPRLPAAVALRSPSPARHGHGLRTSRCGRRWRRCPSGSGTRAGGWPRCRSPSR